MMGSHHIIPRSRLILLVFVLLFLLLPQPGGASGNYGFILRCNNPGKDNRTLFNLNFRAFYEPECIL